jgi:asparagine synthase (glutamine-hydrolysing)
VCGIAGIVYTKSKRVLATDLERQADLIKHRGPDDHGVFLDKTRRVGLVSTRLAIQDLSPKGHMPLSYQNQYWIVFNGEIYNFKSLRRELLKDGFKFDSEGDTEVLLKLYVKYGKNCVKKLRGMFAFCIYDLQKNLLFLARDRFGKKPLKYHYSQGEFIFGSEIKNILPFISRGPQPDYSAIYSYLLLNYIPSPLTGFSSINKLPPGHYMTLDLKSGNLDVQQYYETEFNIENISALDAMETAESLIENSVKSRLIADVPIGSFLSGGVDSSLVTAIAQQNTQYKIKTYSIGFREKQYDESIYARSVADHLGTDHNLILCEKTDVESLPEVIGHFGEPLSDPSMLALWQLSKIASKDVKVVLTGEGGDENFAGYTRLNKFNQYLELSKLKAFSKTQNIDVLKKIYRQTKNPLFRKAATLLTDLQYTNLDIFLNLYSVFTKDFLKDALINTDNLSAYPIIKYKDLNSLEECQQLDLKYYLSDDLFYKVDMTTMAFGLEARAPLSDHRIADYMAKVPYKIKTTKNDGKMLLKKIASKYLPESVVYRPKMGFSLPLDIWFEGSLKTYARDILLSSDAFVKGIFKTETITRMIESHSRQQDSAPKLFNLICLELWAKHHFANHTNA